MIKSFNSNQLLCGDVRSPNQPDRIRSVMRCLLIAACFFAIMASSPSQAFARQKPSEEYSIESLSGYDAKLRGYLQGASGVASSASEDTRGPVVASGKGVLWVLLIDTSQYQYTPTFALGIEKAVDSFWDFGLIRPGDRVSVLPYQLKVDDKPDQWAHPVASSGDLKVLLPKSKFAEGKDGGRDTLFALRYALQKLDKEKAGGTEAVVIVLSAKSISEPPTDDKSYTLVSDNDKALKTFIASRDLTKKGHTVIVPVEDGGKNASITALSYIPTHLTGGASATPAVKHPGTAYTSPIPPGKPAPPYALYALAVLALAIAAVGFVYLLKKIGGRKPDITPTLYILSSSDVELLNCRFPESRRIHLFGGVHEKRVGSKEAPTEISLEDRDLPPEGHGYLLIVDAGGRDRVALLAELYAAEPAEIPYETPTRVSIRPTGGAKGSMRDLTIRVSRKNV